MKIITWVLEKTWEESNTWSQTLRRWWRNRGHSRRWRGEIQTLAVPGSRSWTRAGTPGKGSKESSLSKQKGSKIVFLCPSKCHLCTQGRASQGKSKAKYDPWGGAENLSSGRDRAGRQWQRRLSTQQQLPLCRSVGWRHSPAGGHFSGLFLQHIAERRMHITTSTCHLPPTHLILMPGFL